MQANVPGILVARHLNTPNDLFGGPRGATNRRDDGGCCEVGRAESCERLIMCSVRNESAVCRVSVVAFRGVRLHDERIPLVGAYEDEG